MSVLTRFRLDGGTNQQAARKLLPTEGLLRRVQNMRLRRDNELAVRPGFTAFGTSVYGQGSATLSVYDVVSYDERLFAFGDLSSNPGVSGFFEYVDELKAWRGVLLEIPDATNVREVGQPPDQAGGVTNASVAARGGIVCLAFGTNGGTFSHDSFVHVFRAIDDVTLVYALLDTSQMRNPAALVTEAGKFHAIGSTGSTLFIRSFDPSTDETFAVAASVQSTTLGLFATAAVLGAPGGYVVVTDLSGDLLVRHYNDAHVQQMTRTISGIVPSAIAIDANGPQDVVAVLYELASDSKLYSYAIKLSDGTDIHGPDVVSTVTSAAISIRFVSTSSALAYVGYYGAFAGEAQTVIHAWTPTTASSSGGGSIWHGAEICTELAIVPGVKSGGATEQVFCGLLLGEDIDNLTNAMGIMSARMPIWAKDGGIAVLQSGHISGCGIDRTTGLFYSASLALNETQNACPVVTEWAYGDRSRRQCAVAANELHISGGLPLVFDGRSLVEVGFISAPCIRDLAGTTGASVTSDADYFLQASAEWIDSRRNLHRSPVSVVKSFHTGASDTAIQYHLSVVQSLRLGSASNPGPGQYSIVEYRTAALADKTAGENLFREHSFPNSGAQLPDTLLLSDDDLRASGATLGTIYTQGQTPIPTVAPPPCRYLWPTNDRLAVAGLPRPEQWIQSKQRFPGEAIGFASPDLLPGSQGFAEEEIRGIAALSGSIVAFTRRAISLWQGEGPDDAGQGAFSFAGVLGKEGGLKGWESLCETDEGVLFQRDDDQIYMLDKTHGTLTWVGQAVRDELATYPNVKAAVHLRREHAVAFAVQNDAGDAGELLVFDLRRKQWFIDDVLAVALAEYQGRLVYVDTSGVCHYQAASPGSGAMPSQNFETFDFDFGAGLGWGDIINVGIVGTKVADCAATLDVTYDSGASYTTIGSWTLSTANGYASGGLLQLKKAPPLRRCSRFGLRFNVTGGSDTEGVRVNEITLETEAAPGMARLPLRDTQ